MSNLDEKDATVITFMGRALNLQEQMGMGDEVATLKIQKSKLKILNLATLDEDKDGSRFCLRWFCLPWLDCLRE